MDSEFGENPFQNLDISRFPKGGEPAQNSCLDQADRDLFLAAVNRPQPVKKQGFPLSDICTLPEIKMKKKKVASLAPPVVTKPAPPEDEELFLTAVRTAKPLEARGRDIAKKPVLRPPARLQEETLDDFMAGKLEFAVSFSNEYLEGHVVGMDELVMNRLREGQFSAEANLDLHGLNASQAFEALKVFIRNAWLKDLRSVLVVTGRGRNSPDGQAVLRQKMQSWLTKEPFKRVVMAFCTAKPHDGGPGSIYVLLRRFRKKGPIFWERMFVEEDP